MILVDRALQEREAAGRPVRVGLVGAGFMGSGIIRQIARSTPGMEVVAVANRSVDRAKAACADVGLDPAVVDSADAALAAWAAGHVAVTDDWTVLTDTPGIDCLVEVTGAVEHSAHVVTRAIERDRDVVLMNAELDGTVGPLLHAEAAERGVVVTACDGDQPGVEMNLIRFVRGLGLEPLVAGNIKGLQDPYRNPTTQQGFAERWGQNVHMVTSFADGTKISFEQAIVANGAGMTVERRGMRGGDHHGHVDELVDRYDVDELRALGGVVDYVVGARPGPGVFVLGAHDDPRQRHYLELYKLGTGPLYSFYTPYHLCHFEVPASVARVALFRDEILTALDGPRVEVVTTAKRDLAAGDTLDGLGGYDTYGQAERADVTARDRLLPMGVAEGCRLRRSVARDELLTYDDVELPPGRLIDELRARQAARWPS